MFKPSSNFLLTVPGRCFCCVSFLSLLYCRVYSLPALERADPLALLCMMFHCVACKTWSAHRDHDSVAGVVWTSRFWFPNDNFQRDASISFKVRKIAKIRNRYNQVPHLTQDTNGKVTNPQLDITNESQEGGVFPAGDHKASIHRRPRKQQTQDRKDMNDPKRSTALERLVKYFTGGLKPVSRRQPRP